MAIYDYHCSECEQDFSVRQSMAENPYETHAEVPACEFEKKCHGPVKRLISAPSVHFKGSGFYETDYKRK